MKREFVLELLAEITDEAKKKEIVDKIMAENGSDVNKAKGDLETLKTEKKALEGQLSTANATIEDLQKKNPDIEGMQKQIEDYKAEVKKLNDEHAAELTKLARDGILTKALGKYKAKNEVAVKALVGELEAKDNADYETLLEAKLKTLSEAEDTRFMFGEAETKPNYNPAGGGNPEPKGYGASMAESRNTVSAPAYDPWATK